MPTHEIRFDHRPNEDFGALEIVPSVDGVPLTELIDSYELGAGMKPAGGAYGGLIPELLRFGPMTDHFHGQSTDALGPKTPVLGCDCGDWGCWPLMACITVTDTLVTWDSFEQPYRPARDYTGFGPFHFDRHDYDQALHDITARAATGP